jgi:HK97 family phage portal protein
MKLAWQMVRGIMATGRKAGPYLYPDSRTGQPQQHPINYGVYATEAFSKNSVVYTGIMYKVRAMVSAPLRAYEGTRKEPHLLPISHDLQKLVMRPNPSQSWEEFMGYLIVSLNIDGNSYVQLEREDGNGEGRPIGMYPLRPDKVYIVPNNTESGRRGVMGYVYVPEGRSAYEKWGAQQRRQARDDGKVKHYTHDDIIHVKYPNPLDDLDGMGYGLSPQSPLANIITADNQLTKFIKDFIQRGGVPPFWFSFDVPLDDGDIAQLRDYVQSIYGGADNWLRPGVLDKGGKVQRLGLTLDELGFSGMDERDETRLLGPQGVPPMVVGTRVGLYRSTYENYENARRAFWQDTMWPDLRLFEVEFQHYLNTETEFVMFDMSEVPAISQDVENLISAAHKAWTMGTPANIGLDGVGLHWPDIPGGDVAYVPVNTYPVNADISEAFDRGNTPSPPASRIVADNQGEDVEKSVRALVRETMLKLQTAGDRGQFLKALAQERRTTRIPMAAKQAHQNRVDRLAAAWEARFKRTSSSSC